MRGSSLEDLKRRVREATEIVELVRSYGVDLKRSGRRLVALCPFHQEKTGSFSVNAEGQYFKCFGCGKGGDAFTFVMEQERVEFMEALHILADRAAIPVAIEPGAQEEWKRADTWKSYLYKVNGTAATFYRECLHSDAGRAAREYLRGRGLTEQSWKQFGLGYAPGSGGALVQRLRSQRAPLKALEVAGLTGAREDGSAYDYFRDRLLFPIADAQGRVIGFGGRVLGDGEPKYLNTRETPVFVKGRTIYGLTQARDALKETRRAVLVEGYTDVIMCHQHGLKNVVAALGTAITAEHVRALRRLVDELDVLTDSDAAGARASERSVELLLQEEMPARIVRLPGPAKDPCEFLLSRDAEAFRAEMGKGQSLFDYKFQRVAREHDLATPTGQANAARQLMALAQLSPNPALRAALRREIADRLRLPESALQFERPAPRAARPLLPVGEGRVGGGPAPGVEKPEHPLAQAERELLRWLFHQPAWIENAVNAVDLTQLEGGPERVVAKAVLAAVDAGRLPPDLNALSPDSHSLSGKVAHEVLTGLSGDAGLFDGGKLVEEPELERARRLCIELAEEGPVPGLLRPEELYAMFLAALERERLKHELREAKRALAAALARGDTDEIAVAEKCERDAQLAVARAAHKPGARATALR